MSVDGEMRGASAIMVKTDTKPPGFLLVLMQPPPSLEDEFNAWYDTEHIPERAAVPGFKTALRFVCIDGHPRYLAMYDLDSFSVLETEAYKRVAFDNSSPWTKRVTSRVRIYRSAGEQIYAGAKGSGVTGPAARIQLLRFRGLNAADGKAIISGVRAQFEELPEVTQTRVLAHDTRSAGIDYLGIVESVAPIIKPLDPKVFGTHARALDLVNSYAPY
jgi:hypothetical protein